MSKTGEITSEMIEDLIEKANMGDKDALDKLIYFFGPESTIDAATTFLEHGGELPGAIVEDVVDTTERVIDKGGDLFDATMSAFDDLF